VGKICDEMPGEDAQEERSTPAESTGTSFTFWTGDMVYRPLAARVAQVAGFRRALPVFRLMIVVAVAVVMWESRRDFQGVWEGWKAGFLAFHAFHTPSFPRLASGYTCDGVA